MRGCRVVRASSTFPVLLLLVLWVCGTTQLSAQGPGNGAGGLPVPAPDAAAQPVTGVPPVVTAPAAVSTPAGQFPPMPRRTFFRGIATFAADGSLIPRPELSGFYLSWFKTIFLL